MRLLSALALPLAAAAAAVIQHDAGLVSPLDIPTVHESAVLARRIVALSKIGTLSTVFQPAARELADADDVAANAVPPGLVGAPIGLPDYFADCGGRDDGSPTILAIDIATPFRNVRAGSNISLAIEWVPPYPPAKRISLWSRLSGLFSSSSPSSSSDDGSDTPDTSPYSAANLPRFSLIGYLEPLVEDAADDDGVDASGTGDALAKCFVAKHPDARYWLPGNRIHHSRWARLVVTHLYWVGGFGDRAYIGWIPAAEYAAVTREEWEAVRLPGEKPGWKEWSVDL
jgi:hypothetical protein